MLLLSLPVYCSLLMLHNLPSLPDLINGNWSMTACKSWMNGLFGSRELSTIQEDYNHLPAPNCLSPLENLSLTRLYNTRSLPTYIQISICHLVGWDGLEADAICIRHHSHHGNTVNCAYLQIIYVGGWQFCSLLTRCLALDSCWSLCPHVVYLCDNDAARSVNLTLGIE